MDLEIKKDITSNWFKMLQEAIWHTITCLLYTSDAADDA